MEIKLKLFGSENVKLEPEAYRGIPTMEYAGNGQFWIAWYGGGDGEQPGNYISYSRSFDYGRTWTPQAPAVVPENPELHRAFDPCLWRCPDGRLWLFWSVAAGKTDKVMVCGSWTSANYSSWAEPVTIAPGIMMNKPVVLSNGEWMLPVAYWSMIGENPEKGSARVYISKDSGKSFHYRGSTVIPDSECDEHMIIESGAGKLQMFARNCKGIAESHSTDWGYTWSPGQQSALYGAVSRFFIRRLSSGRILLVNHASPGPVKHGQYPKRTNLTAYLSDDDGKSWPHALLLDSRPDVSYPDGTQDENGRVYIVYDRERFDSRKIIFMSFTENDIINKRTPSYLELGRHCEDICPDAVIS